MGWLKRIPTRTDRAIVVTLVSTGLLLPLAVGIGVKLYLQGRGIPTVPWENIGAYALYFGPLDSVIAAAPLILLAVLYRHWTIGKLRWFSRATSLQGRLVVLSGFAGCVAGMVREFVGVFWEFDALILWVMPLVVAKYLPWMAAGLVVGGLLAVVAGFVAGESAGTRPTEREPVDAGAGASPATAQGLLDPALAAEATSRARSVRNAAAAALVAEIVATAVWVMRASEEGSIPQRFLLGVSMVCFVWASWAILRGAWLLGSGWKAGFFVCWVLGPPFLVFGLVVFLKLRRMGTEAGRGRPAGHAGPRRMAEA